MEIIVIWIYSTRKRYSNMCSLVSFGSSEHGAYGYHSIEIASICSVEYFQTMDKASYDVLQVFHNE
jgi:hypothetical protein